MEEALIHWSPVNKIPRYSISYAWAKIHPWPGGSIQPFPVEKRDSRPRVVDSHPNCFTVSCKRPQFMLKAIDWRCQQNHIICKTRHEVLSFPNYKISAPWLHLESLTMNSTKDWAKGQPIMPTCDPDSQMNYILQYISASGGGVYVSVLFRMIELSKR